MDAFETQQWSNVVCTHRAELLYNMSQQGYIERQERARRAPVRPGQRQSPHGKIKD
jgi:hypothetical protein